MKKWLSLFLVVALMAACLCGCTDDSGNDHTFTTKQQEQSSSSKPVGQEEETADRLTGTAEEELCYVLIYNPLIYDENSETHYESRGTGYLGSQVDTNASRADGLPPELLYTEVSQRDLMEHIDWTELIPEESRGDVLIETYEVGDCRDFYCYDNSILSSRVEQTFTCAYVGEHCYVWSCQSALSDQQLASIGNAFDADIYDQTTAAFGEGRFCAMGGKVNILMYPMQDGLLGCFCGLDSFASGEVSSFQVSYYGCNLNHDIIHINTTYPEYYGADFCYSTLAHEFQHLICFSNMFYTYGYTSCRTWLNEVMSAYIEETLYPNSRYTSGHFDSFAASSLIRNGQSLYNFTTNGNDIGVYGSVYYFSEYLKNLAGSDVYTKIHQYWRESYSSTLCEAEAIYHALPDNVREQIDDMISYPQSVHFSSQEEQIMSKLTLAFYLDMLCNSDRYQHLDVMTMLYDQINAAQIEGGGRIIIAVKDGEFEIPDGADNGLIYVGLNEDFEVITDFVTNG